MEEWRKKRYYDPRIIIDIDDVLENPFPLVIACFTGDEVCILRNLMAYAHRRSTFASEYFSDYYLAPTNEEWDVLESIVAGIEDKLMSNCDEITNRLDTIIQLLGSRGDGKSLYEIYHADLVKLPGYGTLDNYEWTILVGDGDPPPGYESWEEWKGDLCLWLQSYLDMVAQTLDTFQNIWTAFGAIGETALAAVMLATGIGIPITIATSVIGAIAVTVARLGFDILKAELEIHRYAIICAMYNATTGWEAYTAAAAVIDANLNFPFNVYLKLLMNRSNTTAWFEGSRDNYLQQGHSPEYCTSCAGMLIDEEHTWYFPPCPNDWEGPGIDCCPADGRLIAAWIGSNWYANISPSWYQAAGDIAISYSAWIFFDFSKWDFPPQMDDDVFVVGLKRASTGACVSSRWFQREDVIDGWNLLQIVDTTTVIVADDYRMTIGHLDTNARCTGVRVSGCGCTVTYN